MDIFTRLFLFVQIFLISIPVATQTARIVPFSLSVTQSYEYPADQNSTRAVLSAKQLRSALQLDGPEVRSWNVRMRLFQRFQVLGGSVSVSELPARAKNPVPALVTPVFRPVTAATGWLLGPGQTKTTSILAAETKGPFYHFAAFGNPEDPVHQGSWTYGAIEIPERLPFRTSLRVAMFGGITTRKTKKNTAWFSADPHMPATAALYPGAEITVTNRVLTCSASGFRTMPRLARDTAAIRADAALTLGILTLAGAFFRSDSGFFEFDGTPTRIRERRLAAPSLLFRIPGTRKTVSRIRFLYARDIISPVKIDTPLTARDWYGSRISVENSLILLQGTLVHTDEQFSLAGRGTLYRSFFSWLRTDLEGKAEIPDRSLSRHAWLNQRYRMRVTINTSGSKSRLKASASAEMTQKDRYNPIGYRFGGLVSATLFSTHTRGRLCVEGYYATEKPVMEAKISFSGLLR